MTSDELAQVVNDKFGSGAQFEVVDPINHLEVEVLTTARVGGLGFKDKTNQNPTGVKWEDFEFAFIRVTDPHEHGPEPLEYIIAEHLPTGNTIDSPCAEVLRDGGEVYGSTLLQLAQKADSGGE